MPRAPFSEPVPTSDSSFLLLSYLDFYRGVLVSKLDDLSPEQIRASNVPSGWTPAGLINHMANVERRWMRWGFLAEAIEDPWRDHTPTGWVVPEASTEDLKALLFDSGRQTRAIVEAHQLTDKARIGGRFSKVKEAPDLFWILLHLIQEYARHAGHLDISAELTAHDQLQGAPAAD